MIVHLHHYLLVVLMLSDLIVMFPCYMLTAYQCIIAAWSSLTPQCSAFIFSIFQLTQQYPNSRVNSVSLCFLLCSMLQWYRVRMTGEWLTALLRSVPSKDQQWTWAAPTDTHLLYRELRIDSGSGQCRMRIMWIWKMNQSIQVVCSITALWESQTWEWETLNIWNTVICRTLFVQTKKW